MVLQVCLAESYPLRGSSSPNPLMFDLSITAQSQSPRDLFYCLDQLLLSPTQTPNDNADETERKQLKRKKKATIAMAKIPKFELMPHAFPSSNISPDATFIFKPQEIISK